MKTILITGAGGLIGSEAVNYFATQGHKIYGIENNQRQIFFGEKGSTLNRLNVLINTHSNFINYFIDIRNKQEVNNLFKTIKFDVVIHTAAQPSHDKSSSIPFEDFEINANGTLHLLESTRQTNKDCVFIHMSTNKVYGDRPNEIKLKELNTRYDYDDVNFNNGISEMLSIDHSTHSLFGASKVAADILVQEYGRYFKIPTVCLRGGCLTGENHSGVELHGFLNYMIKCYKSDNVYKIYGYKGKQVRDNIHSSDVVNFMQLFINNPQIAAVYNIGGSKSNSCSIIECISMLEHIGRKKFNYEYVDENRKGDHICYYSDLTKLKNDYPQFKITKNLEYITEQILNN
jgi:CDP-paratose 2-epimerase